MKRSAPTVTSNSSEPSNKCIFLRDGLDDVLKIDSIDAAVDGGNGSSATTVSALLPNELPNSEATAEHGSDAATVVGVPTLLTRRNYVNNNYILRFNITNCVPNLPKQLESLLKMNMTETIANRQRVLANGETPYFFIKNGLNPTVKWTDTVTIGDEWTLPAICCGIVVQRWRTRI